MKKSKNSIIIFFLILLYWAGIVLPVHNIILVIIVVAYLLSLSNWIRTKSIAIPKLIIISLLLQNTLLGVGMHVFGAKGDDITLYSQVPTLFLFISGGIIIIEQAKRKAHRLFYLYLIIIFFNFVISVNKSFLTLAYNVRNFIIFYFAFVVGGYCLDSDIKYKIFKRFFINVCLVAGVVGIVGYVTNEQLYVWLGATEVAGVKAINTEAFIRDGLPGYFYGEFFGTFYWRLASLFLEPVNFSSFLALGVILQALDLSYFVGKIKLAFLISCIILTFGKGGLLIAGLSLISSIVYKLLVRDLRLGKTTSYRFAKWGIIIGVIGAGVLYGMFFSYNIHFYSIRITFEALLRKPLGFGIGSVGNVNRFAQQSTSWLGAETGVLNFWCQLGIEGLIVFAMLLLRMSKKCFISYFRNNSTEKFVFSLMPIILFLVFIFQENVFTTQVITGYMFIIGNLARTSEINDKEIKV